MNANNQKIRSGNSFKSIAMFLGFVSLVVLISLSPEAYREFQAKKFSQQQQQCFTGQRVFESSVAAFLEKNPGRFFSPGLLTDSEFSQELLQQKLIQAIPVCPAEGILRIGSLDMSGAYVVTCSRHGSHDRPASIRGKVELSTSDGGILVYDVEILRDNADVLAAYLLSIGVLAQPQTRVLAAIEADSVQISFKAKIDPAKSEAARERFAFHAKEISHQIFAGKKVEFKLVAGNGAKDLLIRSDDP